MVNKNYFRLKSHKKIFNFKPADRTSREQPLRASCAPAPPPPSLFVVCRQVWLFMGGSGSRGTEQLITHLPCTAAARRGAERTVHTHAAAFTLHMQVKILSQQEGSQ